ncbi:MAG: hypothetical protein M3362_07055 [Acidobacteriota bacterium]|nr:hypothetical protein [Acidobacteriota bacterium]
MITETVLDKDQEVNDELKDLIVSKIVEMGCACTTDLAGQIGNGVKPNDLLPALDSLVKNGILRRKEDKNDPRKYNEYQTVYELAR